MMGAFEKRNIMEEIARVITLLILLLQLAVVLRVFREGDSSSFPPGYSSFFILAKTAQISTPKRCAAPFGYH
jgi:hypothetical protein